MSLKNVCIITPYGEESKEVLSRLKNKQEVVNEKGTIFYQSTFQGDYTAWNVFVALYDQGDAVSLALTTQEAISFFSPSFVLYVGNAVGLKDLTLGEVINVTDVHHADGISASVESKATKWAAGCFKFPSPIPYPLTIRGGWIASGYSFAQLEEHPFPIDSFLLAIKAEAHGFGKVMFRNPQIEKMMICGIARIAFADFENEDDFLTWKKIASRNAAAFAFGILKNK